MKERLDRLEASVEAIKTSVARLEERISVMELGELRSVAVSETGAEGAGDEQVATNFDSALSAVMGTPTLVGRSLLVLAGAFLLRALTERGTFASTTGVAMGVAYAASWIIAAGLAGKKGARASAGFYAVCSALIAGPLLFEAATSFGVFSPSASILALAGMTVAGLYVAVRWRLAAAAWVFTLACLGTAAAVATVRPPGETATAVVVALGLGILWTADKHQWIGLKWVAAFVADLAVLRLTAIAAAHGGLPESVGAVHPSVVALIQAVLVVGFVGTFVLRSLRGVDSLGAFEFTQTVTVWAVGWAGAVRLAEVHGWATSGLSIATLVAGAAAYSGAFGMVDRKQGRNQAFVYLSSLGLGLVVVGMPGIAGGASSALWASLALVAAVVDSRWDRVTLRVHAAVLLIAAWFAAGAALEVAADLGGGGAVDTSPSGEIIVVAVLTLATTAVVAVGRKLRSPGWVQRLPLAVLLLLSAMATATAIVVLMVWLLPRGLVSGTVALSLVTVGLALLAKRWGVVEAGWLVYPLLILTGLRLVARDFTAGQTQILVIGLAAYGTALIVSTRLVGVGVRSVTDDRSAADDDTQRDDEVRHQGA